MWRFSLLGTAAVAVCLVRAVAGQSGKSQLPRCPSNESVCNALLHFPDRVVDQGRYCNGCANCSLPSDADAENALESLSGSSFYWQHWEDPKLRVQFVKCSPMPQRPACAQQPQEPAAVFVSPRSTWSPSLHQLRCTCQPPFYQLRSWRAEGENWYYEFTCQLPACGVPQEHGGTGGGGGESSVCAVKRRANEDSPASVEFKCACPEYHCIIKDVETKRSASEQGAEGRPSSDADWQPETADGDTNGGGGGGGDVGDGGGQISRRRCQRTHSSNSSTVLHR